MVHVPANLLVPLGWTGLNRLYCPGKWSVCVEGGWGGVLFVCECVFRRTHSLSCHPLDPL